MIAATFGVDGLGLSKDLNALNYTALLGLIPLVCVYVDLLCANLNQRIILIGKHFAQHLGDAYERRARTAGEKGWFDLEDFALYGSTYAACILLSLFALVKLLFLIRSGNLPQSGSLIQAAAIMGGSVLGLILIYATYAKESRIRGGNMPVLVQNTDMGNADE